MNFDYIQNPDGSFVLYNTVIGDIYFSNIGAYNEAIEKFVLPSKPENIKKKNIKILDVCYGMGYNSKSFVDYCLKNNLNFDFDIDCIELDKNILSLGLLIFDKNISNDIHYKFGLSLLSQIDLKENVEKISGENWINSFWDSLLSMIDQKNYNSVVHLYKNNDFYGFLHNIYYQNHDKLDNFNENLNINFILGDLLEILPTLDKKYDLIFHDAFSIKKQPELWDKNIMESYYNLLNDGGKLLTYSKSVVLHRLLNDLGFKTEYIYTNDNKKNSTLATKY